MTSRPLATPGLQPASATGVFNDIRTDHISLLDTNTFKIIAFSFNVKGGPVAGAPVR